jgi:hypothetical protein
VSAQDNDTIPKKQKEKLERPAFESSYVIDNPTDVVLRKNAFEVMMQHRFGKFNDDQNDLAGFWGTTNIRIGVSYGVHERITIGFGTTKYGRYQDLNWKVAVLQQTRSKKMPINLTYYGNVTASAKPKEFFINTSDRWSFINQLIISKRFNSKLSMQIVGSWSHYNAVETTMRNDMISVAYGARYKISPQTAIIVDYSQPFTQFIDDNPHPGLSFGVEIGTSSHAFQLFISNYKAIIMQDNYMFNDNDIVIKDMFLGFNITRVYNF